MITFKQVEALYWIVELGSFEAAASKLNASQSAISKRIHELETALDLAVFDRHRRSARLTEKGEELFQYAKELLDRRDQIVERISAKEVLIRRFRLGVTELTALTWLPRLIAAIKAAYPRVIIDAEVELSATLRERLADGTIDFIVVPAGSQGDGYVSTSLAAVENAWMCVPGMVPKRAAPIPLAELAAYPLLTQGNASGTGLAYGRFLQDHGINVRNSLASNNLLAQVGLTVSGIGVSYLPRACLQYLVSGGVLDIVRTTPPLPAIRYVALYRSDHPYSLASEVARMAAECCDFGTLLLGPVSGGR